MTKIFTFTLICAVLIGSESYKILGLCQIPLRSHYRLALKLFTEIAKNGHEVTFVTAHRSKTPHKNLNEIPVESLQNVIKSVPVLDLENQTPFEVGRYAVQVYYNLTEHLLRSNQLQQLLTANEKFDAVIVYQYMNDALQAIGHYFKTPVILFSSMRMYPPESFVLSYPTNPAYISNILTEYTGQMNFWQRLRNTFYDITITLFYLWDILPKYRKLVYEHVSDDLDVYKFLNNASLALINTHFSLNEAIPHVSNAIEIGGYHMGESKPLPEDLKKFLDGSTDGFILFSMGSILKSADFPKNKLNIIMKTFSKLRHNVLFKWEDDEVPDLPNNVKIMKWIPQFDVLAHPNVKAFISHGGLSSMMESAHLGIPVVGMPMVIDQKTNIALAASSGCAIQIPFRELTDEKLTWALNEVINNPKYKINCKRRSSLFRDRPKKPVDVATKWIEYVIRYKGAPHLRYPGMDVNWFERNLLDVLTFLLIAFIAPAVLTFLLLKKLFNSNFR